MSKGNLSRTENQGAPRLGFDAYNISRERYIELRNGCAAGKYSREILREACRGLEFIQPWIILSFTKSMSFDRIEFDLKLGRIPVGRSDFYGFRRKFYHNLDVLLNQEQGACDYQVPAGEPKGIEVYESQWRANGQEFCSYEYCNSAERFERPIRKSYRISIHESFRENGKVRKKQTVICTIGYYDVVDYSDWPGEYVVGGLASKADALGLEESELPDLIYTKWQAWGV